MLLLKMSLAALQWFIIIKDLVYSQIVFKNWFIVYQQTQNWQKLESHIRKRSAYLTKLRRCPYVHELYCTVRTPKMLDAFLSNLFHNSNIVSVCYCLMEIFVYLCVPSNRTSEVCVNSLDTSLFFLWLTNGDSDLNTLSMGLVFLKRGFRSRKASMQSNSACCRHSIPENTTFESIGWSYWSYTRTSNPWFLRLRTIQSFAAWWTGTDTHVFDTQGTIDVQRTRWRTMLLLLALPRALLRRLRGLRYWRTLMEILSKSASSAQLHKTLSLRCNIKVALTISGFVDWSEGRTSKMTRKLPDVESFHMFSSILLGSSQDAVKHCCSVTRIEEMLASVMLMISRSRGLIWGTEVHPKCARTLFRISCLILYL